MTWLVVLLAAAPASGSLRAIPAAPRPLPALSAAPLSAGLAAPSLLRAGPSLSLAAPSLSPAAPALSPAAPALFPAAPALFPAAPAPGAPPSALPLPAPARAAGAAPVSAPADAPALGLLGALAAPQAASLVDAAFDGLAAAPADDASGASMAGAIESARGLAVGASLELGFRPSPAGLRRLARLEGFELLLARRRGGGWILVKGGTGHVPAVAGDFDAYIHNHYYHPVLAKSFTPYPSDGDLVFSAGKDARFFVVSESGVVEWSPRIPYYPYARERLTPARRERLLDPARDENHDWHRRFRRGNGRRAALNLILPAFYDRLLRASGISFELYRWSDRRLTQAFLDSGPVRPAREGP